MSGIADRPAEGSIRGEPNIRVEPVRNRLLEPAALRLAEHNAPGDPDAGRRFLLAAKAQGVDLRCFYAAIDHNGHVLEAALAVPGAGRTAMFFTSHPTDTAAEHALTAAIIAACNALDGPTLPQAHLLPGEAAAARAFNRARFLELARLAYLRWRRNPKRQAHTNQPSLAEPPPSWAHAAGKPALNAEGITLRRVSAVPIGQRDQRLTEALRRSYEDTLDCPALCRMREPADVLASHRAVGHFDPSLWWLVETEDQPVGVVLWTPIRGSSAAPAAAELVYMGIAPAVRGNGLGTKLLRFTAADVLQRDCKELTCAVDLNNTPARSMYERFGFRAYAERRALVRDVGDRSCITP